MLKLYSKCDGNYEGLLSYYPGFYSQIYEMTELLKAQGGLADGLQSSIERIFSDCFIDTAESEVIAEYEKIFGIADSGKSLDERRKLVKACAVGSGKISASVICEIIRTYTGAEVGCSLSADNTGNNILNISAKRGTGLLNLKDIDSLLSGKLPAHIEYCLSLKYSQAISLSLDVKHFSTKIPECGRFVCGQKIMI